MGIAREIPTPQIDGVLRRAFALSPPFTYPNDYGGTATVEHVVLSDVVTDMVTFPGHLDQGTVVALISHAHDTGGSLEEFHLLVDTRIHEAVS